MKKAVAAVGFIILVGIGAYSIAGESLQFTLGGAMVNLGYRLQDSLERYDFQHEHLTPPQVWARFQEQNHAAAAVRTRWPRSARHPVIAMVTCMDGRLDTNEIAGDTRRYYYVLRLAGSVLAPKEEEMLELAVANGVEVVVFTTHTDCAAEKTANNPKTRAEFPELSQAIDEREARFNEFLGRPRIRKKIDEGQLIVKWMDLDTSNEGMVPHGQGHSQAPPETQHH